MVHSQSNHQKTEGAYLGPVKPVTYSRGLSTTRASEIGAMTKGNIEGTYKKTVIIIFFAWICEKHTKEILNFFELSQGTIREELRIKNIASFRKDSCNIFIAMTLWEGLSCNNFVAMALV